MAIAVQVVKGDITRMKVEAIANLANSFLTMGGGLAAAIKRAGGQQIEDAAKKSAPLRLGQAVATGAGNLPSKYVIHAPTMIMPAQATTAENVKRAMEGILECAEKNRISEVAVPGLGTGIGGVPFAEAAGAMVKAISSFTPHYVNKVLLVAFNDEMFDAFEEACANIKP